MKLVKIGKFYFNPDNIYCFKYDVAVPPNPEKDQGTSFKDPGLDATLIIWGGSAGAQSMPFEIRGNDADSGFKYLTQISESIVG